MVAYNDSRGRNVNPINISGASVSTDGGTTFTRLTKATVKARSTIPLATQLFCTTSQPHLVHRLARRWDCGGRALGGYKSTTPWDPNSWTHFLRSHRRPATTASLAGPTTIRRLRSSGECTFPGTTSMLAAVLSKSRFSSDNGATWNAPVTVDHYLHPQRPDHRRHQATGACTSPAWTRWVVASPTGPTRSISSTDGGNTWTNTYTGPTFPGPGAALRAIFAYNVS